MMIDPRARPVLIGTALVAVAFALAPGAATAVDAGATPPRTAAAKPGTPAPAAPEGNPVRALPLAQLAITRDRPIFSPSRRPPPPPAPAPVYTVASVPRPVKAEPQRPTLTLVGTVLGANEAIAVFLDRTTREVVRLHTNESHQGWILRSIDGREAKLEKGPDAAVLALAPPGGTPEVTTAQATPDQLRRRQRQRD